MRAQTTKSVRIQFVSLMLAGLISMPAHAEVIPGRWEKVSALEMASSITVELKNGNRIQGQFRGLSSSDLELLNSAGRAAIPRTDIETITLPVKDGLGDGAWKGAVIGSSAAFGTAMIAYAGHAISGTRDKGSDSGWPAAVLVYALCAGIGAGLGMAIDAESKAEDILLYRAPGTP